MISRQNSTQPLQHQDRQDHCQVISTLSKLAKTNSAQISQLTRQIQAKRSSISRISAVQDSLSSKLDQSDLLDATKPWKDHVLEISARADASFSDMILRMNSSTFNAGEQDEDLLLLLMNGVEQDGVVTELIDELKRRVMASKRRNEVIKISRE
jgi:hypothetical protein